MAFNIPVPSHSHLFNSHSLPSHSQFFDSFPFPWDSQCAIPIPSHSHSHTRSGTVVYNYCSLLYGCYIIIDTAQKSCLFIITVLKTFSIGSASYMIPLVYKQCKAHKNSSVTQVCVTKICGNKFPWECR